VRATVVVWVKVPETPVMVTVAKPSVAVLEAVRVSVLVVVALAGLKDAVTPVGRPLAERATDPLKLLSGVIVMVPVVAPPWTAVTAVGAAERE